MGRSAVICLSLAAVASHEQSGFVRDPDGRAADKLPRSRNPDQEADGDQDRDRVRCSSGSTARTGIELQSRDELEHENDGQPYNEHKVGQVMPLQPADADQ